MGRGKVMDREGYWHPEGARQQRPLHIAQVLQPWFEGYKQSVINPGDGRELRV